MNRQGVGQGAALLLFLVVAFLTGYPLFMLAYSSVRTGVPGFPGEFSLQGYRDVYSDPATYETWVNSFRLSAEVTILSMIIAVMFAWVVARTDTPGRRFVVPLMALIYAMPGIFFAMGWAMLGNPRAGLLNYLAVAYLPFQQPPFNTNSWLGMVFVMTLIAVPFKYLLLLGAFRAMDMSLEESSRIAGAGRVRTLLLVGLPVLAPAMLGVMILSFVRGLQALEVPLFLGFPAKIYVFSTRIYDYIANFFPARYAEAGALSLALVVTMFLLIMLQQVYGLYQPTIYWGNYAAALSRPDVQSALHNTFLIAAIGGFAAMVLTWFVAYVVVRTRLRWRRPLELFAWLPWTMPGTVLGLAMLWAYLSVPGLSALYGTPWLLMLGVMVTVIPVGVMVMSGAISQVSTDLEESARIHGASWIRATFGILARITTPTFLYGWLVVAIIISGELAVPLFLYAPGSEMLAIAIFSLFQEGRIEQAAAVFCVVLAAIAAAFTAGALIIRLVQYGTRRREYALAAAEVAVPVPQPIGRSPA